MFFPPSVVRDARLYYGDCLLRMSELPRASVDLVLADLPYGTTQNPWDSVLDLAALWRCYRWVCKPNAAIVLHAAQPFTSVLVCSNLRAFRFDYVWRKTKSTGHLNVRRQPLRDKEDVLVFYRHQPTYHPQLTKGTPFKGRGGQARTLRNYGTYGSFRRDNPGIRHPRQVLDFASVPREQSFHPTQKPIPLLRWLIRTFSDPGDLVLDNCMGSGSTAIAAFCETRRFVGFERNHAIFRLARQRLKNYVERF